MDPNILQFLRENKLLSTQQYFEGYDFDTFKKLEPHHLRELITSPRERILFEIKHKELKQRSDVLPDQAATPSIQNPITDDVNSANLEMKGDLIIDSDQFQMLNETFVITQPGTLDLVEDDRLINKTLVNTEIQSIEGASSSDVTNKLPTSFSKISESQVFKHMSDFDMDIVYAKYAKNGSLEPVDRGKISRCVVKFLLSKSDSKMISRAEFIDAAGTIAATFPGENEGSYYIPSEAEEAAKGRLYQTYKSVRSELADAGIITKRVVRKKENTPNEIVAAASGDTFKEIVIDVAVSMAYLACHTDNKDELLQHWVSSRSERLRLIGQIPIPNYVSKFPVLSMADGFEFFNLDFGYLYPTARNAMDKWIEFSAKVLSYAAQKAKRNSNLRDVINAYEKNDASQLLLSFKILPWILRNPMKAVKKSVKVTPNAKGTPNRPNQLEISDNFIPHFNTDNDDTRKEGGFIEVKLIGSNSKYHTYVYMDNTQYIFADVSAGIDCAFKLYYLFNLEFPKVSAHVWEFLNLAIYKININNGKGGQGPNLEILADILRQTT